MYMSGFSPYGESKDQGKTKPGFLKEGGVVMTPKDSGPSGVPKLPKSAPKEKIARRRDLPKETLPEKFVSKNVLKPSTPAARKQMVELDHIRNKWQEKALKNNLKELGQRTKSASIYKHMLTQFIVLSKKDQKILHKWIMKHEKSIRKLHSARKMLKASTKTKHVIELLDKEIGFWKGLRSKRNKGSFKHMFKNVRTRNGETVDSSIYDTGKPIPVFKLKHPKKSQKSVKIKDGIATLGGLKQDQQHAADDYFIRDSIEKLQIKVEDQFTAYGSAKKEIKETLEGFSSIAKKDAAVISILLEARPERFVVVSTLLEALRSSFKKGGGATPEQEAEKLLTAESDRSSSLLKELSSKRKELAMHKNSVLLPDKPAGTLDGFLGDLSENPLTTKIGDVLPWAVAGFLIYKIRTEG